MRKSRRVVATLAAFSLLGSVSLLKAAEVPLVRLRESGSEKFVGLSTAINAGRVPRWPVELRQIDCRAKPCDRWDLLEQSLNRAATWLAKFSTRDLRFDAAVVLSLVRQLVTSPEFGKAFERARPVADRDFDHPQRRFWLPQFKSPPEVTSRWKLPPEGGERAKINDVIHEALYCKEHGWREEILRHICGPFRDQGGYYSTHAAWVLSLAARNGCVSAEQYEPCARSLQQELAGAQPQKFVPGKTLDIDLYAERVVGLVVTGWPSVDVDRFIETLLSLQSEDGSWGIAADEPPYYRYHATLVVAWAFAEWYRRVVENPELRSWR